MALVVLLVWLRGYYAGTRVFLGELKLFTIVLGYSKVYSFYPAIPSLNIGLPALVAFFFRLLSVTNINGVRA